MTELKKAEKEFMTWLDNVNYSGHTSGYPANHYRLIEGVKDGTERRASFINSDEKTEPYVVVNGAFPKAEQKFTIYQFYEWMKKPNRVSFMQQF